MISQVRIDEQEHLIRELEASLQRTCMEADRRLTVQQQDYERKIQVLMQQLTDVGDGVKPNTGSRSARNYDSKDKDAKLVMSF